jgi:hypothetical protein
MDAAKAVLMLLLTYEYESNLFTIYLRRVTIEADITLVFLFHNKAEQPWGTIRTFKTSFTCLSENTIRCVTVLN